MQPLAYVVPRPLPLGWRVPQREGIAWMKAALERSGVSGDDATRARRLYDLLARQSSVESRVTVLEDYTHQDWDRMELFAAPASGDGQAGPARPWQHPALEERMQVFAATALGVARGTFRDETEAPDLLVQVSCTGYDSPTAAQRVALEKGWTDSTRLLHIGHMGCYAALPALATAADVVRSRAAVLADGTPEAEARATILLVEMCTLHHRVEATDIEIVVQQCLFADGAARLDVTTDRPADRALALLDHHEALVPDTLGEMTWGLADGAFAMTLSRRVPDHIRAGVEGVVSQFLGRHGLSIDDVSIAAIHPGGPRVIEATAEALGFEDEQTRHSRAVLAERGNMSSTTLPHIWAGILEDETVREGDLVLSLAFGPGLTIAANLLRVTG
ncbi:MAG: 3-oxoacyl-[acyl-carrier-protein] synthase III C-terminal domain-containing protein [Bacteroidota bacterium]